MGMESFGSLLVVFRSDGTTLLSAGMKILGLSLAGKARGCQRLLEQIQQHNNCKAESVDNDQVYITG